MSNGYKIAGQAAPSANQDTVLYSVPANKSFLSSSLVVANRNNAGVMSAFRVAVVPAGETLSAKHYLAYGKLVEARENSVMVLGMTLAAGDTVMIHSSSTDLSFTLFGTEQTVTA